MIRGLFFTISFLMSFAASASIEVYQFRTELDQIRFQSLTAELRCPKCQNQNIADSDAPIAKDMKDIVYDMIMADKSDMEIKDYLVARYGTFVLYSPELKGANFLLWGGPPVMLFVGVLFAWWIVRRRDSANSRVSLTRAELEIIDKQLRD